MSIAPIPSAQVSVQQPATPVNITSDRLGKVFRQMKDDCGWTGPEFRAIVKAQMEIGAEGWSWDAAARVLVIESRTTRGKRYRVTEHTCCEARSGEACKLSGQVHWHHAAWTAFARASQPERVRRPRPTAAEYAATVAACDEMF